jgi:hypothetical protein
MSAPAHEESALWLDCHDVGSALASLAAAIGTDQTKLEHTLLDYDEEPWASHFEAPEEQTPREVLGHLGSDVDSVAERLAGAYCLHGTRVLERCDARAATRGAGGQW